MIVTSVEDRKNKLIQALKGVAEEVKQGKKWDNDMCVSDYCRCPFGEALVRAGFDPHTRVYSNAGGLRLFFPEIEVAGLSGSDTVLRIYAAVTRISRANGGYGDALEPDIPGAKLHLVHTLEEVAEVIDQWELS